MSADPGNGGMSMESRGDQWPWGELESDPALMYPTTEPDRPDLGQRWYDASEHIIYVWDGDEWLQAPED